MVEISVVVPVYHGEKSVEPLCARLRDTLRKMDISYEIVLVDDRSPDQSWTQIEQLAEVNPEIHGFRLSRNYGQHVAITAGLANASGQWVVVMDCDMEDPPEDIPRLYEEAMKGFDIVLARRRTRHHSFFRKLAASLYFRLINLLSSQRIDGEFGTFSIISRKVVDAYLRVRDLDRHYLLILHWLGFTRSVIDYEQGLRHDGASTYSLSALITHAISGVLFQSTQFLVWVIGLGFVVSLVGVLLSVVYMAQYFLYGARPGWTSLVVLQLILSGFIIASAGITALYVGRIFEQVKDRPLFFVDEQTTRACSEAEGNRQTLTSRSAVE